MTETNEELGAVRELLKLQTERSRELEAKLATHEEAAAKVHSELFTLREAHSQCESIKAKAVEHERNVSAEYMANCQQELRNEQLRLAESKVSQAGYKWIQAALDAERAVTSRLMDVINNLFTATVAQAQRMGEEKDV